MNMIKSAIVGAAVVAAAACGNDSEDDGTTAAEDSIGPAVEEVTVTELMDAAGCEGEIVEPEMYTREKGECVIDGHEVSVVAFDSQDQRDSWADAARQFGSTVVTGDRWAAGGIGAPGPEAFAAAIEN